MKKSTKISIIGITGISITHIINKIIFSNATSNMITNDKDKKVFSWKLGNISYTVKGNGKPILLIHDLNSTSSSYEWKKVINALSKEHTVYAIDLLGCGLSDKPNITYTTYMYTQLINDFVKHIIGQKTDVCACGNSTSLTLMSAYGNPDIFNKIIITNASDIKFEKTNFQRYSNIKRFILNSHIIGTLIYNILMSRENISKNFKQNLFYNQRAISHELINAYYENAHLYGSFAKYLNSSIVCGYTASPSIEKAVSNINNYIYIIRGNKANDKNIIKAYTSLNPSIETISIESSKCLPQLEQPQKFVKVIKNIID